MKTFITFATMVIFLFSCKDKQAGSEAAAEEHGMTEPVNKDTLLLNLTQKILTTLNNKDYENFAVFIHPTSGVRFSPYAYIDATADRLFSKDQFLDYIRKQKQSPLTWGAYDGSGEPIELTVEDYFQQFVYNADFLNAEKTTVNEFIGGGNTINNLKEAYKNCDFTESYFSGFDQQFEGMDWTALRLVFSNFEGNYFLVGVVHDQWTI